MNNSYHPVYWLHDNLQLPNNEVEELISEIKNSNFDLLCTRDIGTLSTYHIPFYSRPDNIWKEKYEKTNIGRDRAIHRILHDGIGRAEVSDPSGVR